MEDIALIISTFVGGGAFKSLVDYIISKRRKSKRDNFKELFENVHEIYSILNNIKRDTYAKRVIIAIAQNGGGIPRVDSDLRSSTIYETYDYPFYSIKEQWQNQYLSQYHLMLLRDMYSNNIIGVFTKDMKNGNLKDLFESNDVYYAKFCLIKSTETKLYYVAMHYHRNNRDQISDPSQRNAIRSSIRRLKEILNNENKL